MFISIIAQNKKKTLSIERFFLKIKVLSKEIRRETFYVFLAFSIVSVYVFKLKWTFVNRVFSYKFKDKRFF